MTPPIAFAQRLGFLGLIPFVATTIATLLDLGYAAPVVIFILYSGLILSFLGGVHWGLALTAEAPLSRHYGWSMLPTIIAFAAVAASWWLSFVTILAVLAASHLFWLNYERRQLAAVEQLNWYLELRQQLTFTVVALHVIVLIISI